MRGKRGQSFIEALLLMPFFLLLVFFALQIGHIGIAMAIVNYGASSIASRSVQEDGFNASDAEQRFKQLLSVGLQSPTISSTSDGDAITPNITVTACAQLPAYPFVGLFLDKALRSKPTSQTEGEDDCVKGAKGLGPVALKGPPYEFVIHGKSMARMNYKPKP